MVNDPPGSLPGGVLLLSSLSGSGQCLWRYATGDESEWNLLGRQRLPIVGGGATSVSRKLRVPFGGKREPNQRFSPMKGQLCRVNHSMQQRQSSQVVAILCLGTTGIVLSWGFMWALTSGQEIPPALTALLGSIITALGFLAPPRNGGCEPQGQSLFGARHGDTSRSH
jgi:hypothetical protein